MKPTEETEPYEYVLYRREDVFADLEQRYGTEVADVLTDAIEKGEEPTDKLFDLLEVEYKRRVKAERASNKLAKMWIVTLVAGVVSTGIATQECINNSDYKLVELSMPTVEANKDKKNRRHYKTHRRIKRNKIVYKRKQKRQRHVCSEPTPVFLQITKPYVDAFAKTDNIESIIGHSKPVTPEDRIREYRRQINLLPSCKSIEPCSPAQLKCSFEAMEYLEHNAK